MKKKISFIIGTFAAVIGGIAVHCKLKKGKIDSLNENSGKPLD